MFIFLGLASSGQTIDEIEFEAEKYYRDFIDPKVKVNHDLVSWTGDIERDSITKAGNENYEKNNIRQSVYPNAAQNALENFLKLWTLNPSKRHIIYFPIQQLGCYLQKDLQHIALPEIKTYFPHTEFTYLRKNWKCDYTINYLFEMRMSDNTIKNVENQLRNLEEPNLYKMKLNSEEQIFRFTWLRTFHQPIVIRFENKNGEYILYYKIGKGAGGYKPEGIFQQKIIKLSAEEFETFQTLIDYEDYINFRYNQSMVIGDGAMWIMEEKLPNEFRVKKTQKPETHLYRACMYLIKLANLNIKEREIY